MTQWSPFAKAVMLTGAVTIRPGHLAAFPKIVWRRTSSLARAVGWSCLQRNIFDIFQSALIVFVLPAIQIHSTLQQDLMHGGPGERETRQEALMRYLRKAQTHVTAAGRNAWKALRSFDRETLFGSIVPSIGWVVACSVLSHGLQRQVQGLRITPRGQESWSSPRINSRSALVIACRVCGLALSVLLLIVTENVRLTPELAYRAHLIADQSHRRHGDSSGNSPSGTVTCLQSSQRSAETESTGSLPELGEEPRRPTGRAEQVASWTDPALRKRAMALMLQRPLASFCFDVQKLCLSASLGRTPPLRHSTALASGIWVVGMMAGAANDYLCVLRSAGLCQWASLTAAVSLEAPESREKVVPESVDDWYDAPEIDLRDDHTPATRRLDPDTDSCVASCPVAVAANQASSTGMSDGDWVDLSDVGMAAYVETPSTLFEPSLISLELEEIGSDGLEDLLPLQHPPEDLDVHHDQDIDFRAEQHIKSQAVEDWLSQSKVIKASVRMQPSQGCIGAILLSSKRRKKLAGQVVESLAPCLPRPPHLLPPPETRLWPTTNTSTSRKRKLLAFLHIREQDEAALLAMLCLSGLRFAYEVAQVPRK